MRKGFCGCGCGEKTSIIKNTDRRIGALKGESRRFLIGHSQSKNPWQFEVDKKTGCWVWLRGVDDNGYGLIDFGGRRDRAHRVIYKWFRGKIKKGFLIDHIDCPKFCVNPFHVRATSGAKNLQNTKIYKNNKTGFKGVYPKSGSTFQVTIRRNRKTISLGNFKSVREAARAYDLKVRELSDGVEPIRVNFPKTGELPAR